MAIIAKANSETEPEACGTHMEINVLSKSPKYSSGSQHPARNPSRARARGSTRSGRASCAQTSQEAADETLAGGGSPRNYTGASPKRDEDASHERLSKDASHERLSKDASYRTRVLFLEHCVLRRMAGGRLRLDVQTGGHCVRRDGCLCWLSQLVGNPIQGSWKCRAKRRAQWSLVTDRATCPLAGRTTADSWDVSSEGRGGCWRGQRPWKMCRYSLHK